MSPELPLPVFLKMVDSIEAADLPATAGILDADIAAGYVDGKWPSYAAIVARFPSALVLSVTIAQGTFADFIDHEPGDAGVAASVAQVEGKLSEGIYCDLADWPAVIAAIAAAGAPRPVYWVADELEQYPAELPAIPADWITLGCVAWQFALAPGISPGPYDVSSVLFELALPRAAGAEHGGPREHASRYRHERPAVGDGHRLARRRPQRPGGHVQQGPGTGSSSRT